MEIRRKVKNVIYKYSEPERLVREATSNDPWGPTSTVMSALADLSYKEICREEMMIIIWKRLNDKGKNWRHVYKCLLLLDYLIKFGDLQISVYCLNNIHSIDTLKDFQYFEEYKDHGFSIREKSKALVTLLMDEEGLILERQKGKKIKEKLHGSRNALGLKQRRRPGDLGKEIRRQVNARELKFSQSVMQLNFDESKSDEEDADFKMAIALSKEEHELSMKKKLENERVEEFKLMMALEQSKKEDEILAVLRLPPKNSKTVQTSDFLKCSSEESSQKLYKLSEESRVLGEMNAFNETEEVNDCWGSPNLNHSRSNMSLDFDSWMTDSNFTTPSFNNNTCTNSGWTNQENEKIKSIIDDIFGEEKPNIHFDTNWSFNNEDKTIHSSVEKENQMVDLWKVEAVPDNPNFTKNITGSLSSLTCVEINIEDASMKHSCSVANLSASRSKITPEEFLGDNAKLVNLDNLLRTGKEGVYRDPTSYDQKNAFGTKKNPFNNPIIQIKKPMNQMSIRFKQKMFASSGNVNFVNNNFNSMFQLPQPIIPQSQFNGFLVNGNTSTNDGDLWPSQTPSVPSNPWNQF